MTMLAEVSNMRKGIDDVNTRLGSMGKTVTGVGRMVKGLAAGFIAFKAASFVTDSIREASSAIAEQDKLLAQTQATLKSTGGAAGVTAKQILNMSDAIERKSLIDAEQIQAGQNMLLTFTNIRNEAGKGNDIFNQTTKVMADLSTAMGQSTKSSALQLGKALNDPVKGISALSRVGVSFTQQQKDQVAAMVATGNTMGAQKLILAELNKEFGGSAKAAGQTFAGQVKHLNDVWDGFVESMLRKVLPTLTVVVGYLAKHLPHWLDVAGQAFSAVGRFISPAVDALKGFFDSGSEGQSKMSPLVSFIQTKVIPGIQGIVTAYQNLAAVVVPIVRQVVDGITSKWSEIQPQLQSIWNSVKEIITSALTIIQTYVRTGTAVLSAIWAKFGTNIVRYVTNSLSGVIKVVSGAFKIISGLFKVVSSLLKGDWKGAWDGIKKIASGALQVIKGLIQVSFAQVRLIIGAAWTAVKTLTSAAWNAMKSAVSKGIQLQIALVKSIPGRIKSALGNLGSLLLDAGKAIIQGLIDGIQSKIGDVEGMLKSVTDKIPDWKGPKNRDKKLLTPTGKWIMEGLVKGFEDGQAGIKNSLGDITKFIEKFYDKKFKNDKDAKKHSKAAIKSLGNETKALMKNAKKREVIYKRLEDARKRLEDLKKTRDDYKSSVIAGVKDFTNITGLDAAFNAPAMLAELKKRLEKTQQFAKLIKDLVAKGLNKDMVAQLVAAGVDGGLAYAQAISDGGSDAIKQFNDLQTQINTAANGLGNTAADSMYQSGIQAAQGLVAGLVAQKKQLEKVARQLAKDLIKAIKDELKIKSPSRVFKAVGEFTIAGLAEGLNNTSAIDKAMSNVSGAVVNGYNANVSGTGAGTQKSGEVHIHFDGLVAGNPKDVARQVKAVLMNLEPHERRAIFA